MPYIAWYPVAFPDGFFWDASGITGKGSAVPAWTPLYPAFPVSFMGRLIQPIKRIPSEIDGKTEAVLYDYFDERSPVLKKFSVKRLKTYKVVGAT